MTQNELQDIIRHSEVSTVQFKERIDDNYKIGTELVAFSNSKGGRLFIGIKRQDWGNESIVISRDTGHL